MLHITIPHCMPEKISKTSKTDNSCLFVWSTVPLTVFEIQGFNLKNKNDKKKNWRNRLFTISPMFVVQF